MPVFETGLLALFKAVSFILDVVTYLPFYLIQEQSKVLHRSSSKKARLIGGPNGYWQAVNSHELSTTPDGDCQTVAELFEKSASVHQDKPCLGTREFFREEDEVQPNGKVFKKSILGEYQWKTFGQVLDEVKFLGRGLTQTGMSPSRKILIFAETRADWMIAAQACFRQNFPVVTLYATLGEDAIVYGINESEVTHVITSSDLLSKFKKIASRIPTVKCIIYMKGKTPVNPTKLSEGTNFSIVCMDEITERGRSVENYVDTMPISSDIALVMYTSGSTGLPKGVLLSHANVLAAVSGLLERARLMPADTYVGYLPLAHILEICAELTCLCVGCRIGYSSPNTLTDASTAIKKGGLGDVSILRPTLMACVPTVMDRIYKSVWDKVAAGSAVKRVLFRFAVDYKTKWLTRGGDTPLINRVVMSSITKLLGGQVRSMISGGAPLNPQTQEFLRLCLCCPVIQGYGLTETCCAGTIGDLADLSFGHVGAPLTCCRLKLVSWEEGNYRNTDNPPSGEVWIGGPSVALGYHKNKEKTREDFEESDGTRWFKTGDIGVMRPDGTLMIVDRKKDLVKLQAGEYVSLGKVEACLRLCPLVDNICVFANSMLTFTVAVVVPNPKTLNDVAKSLSIDLEWPALCANTELKNKVLAEIQKQGTAGGLERFEIPAEIHLTADIWTPDTGLITDSLKLKRKQLEDKYGETIRNMYNRRSS